MDAVLVAESTHFFRFVVGQVTHGHERLQFSEFDDPHTSVNKLMLALRGLNFALNIPATRLKTAHGEAACSVLEFLVDAALKESGFKWQTPSYADSNDVEQAADDSSADLGEVEEELAQSDAEEVLFNEIAQMDPHETSLEHSQRNIIEAGAIDAEVWKKELERVAPRLRTTQPQLLSGSNEWRAHIEQTQTNRQMVAGLVNNANGDLQIISKDVLGASSVLSDKEKSINTHFQEIARSFQSVKQELNGIESQYNNSNETVMRLTNTLDEIQSRIAELRESVSAKDSSMSDASPLVQIKAALQDVKAEILSFDLRIGVVSKSLTQAKMNSVKRKKKRVSRSATKRQPAQDQDEDRYSDMDV